MTVKQLYRFYHKLTLDMTLIIAQDTPFVLDYLW